MSAEKTDEYEVEEMHIVPTGDLKEHVGTSSCWCNPYLDAEADFPLFIHNALDGRDKRLN